MPAAYIHEQISRKALSNFKKLPFFMENNIDAFELGAQGPDPLFYHGVLNIFEKDKRPNLLGEEIHKKKVRRFFRALLTHVQKQQGASFAWLLGFVCHYATDSTIHPYVYFTTNNEDGMSNTTRHLVLESQFDTWYYRYLKNKGIPRQAGCLQRLAKEQKHDVSCVLYLAANDVFPEFRLTYRQAFNAIGDMDKVIGLLYSTRKIKHNIFTFLENIVRRPQILTRHAAAQMLPDYDFINTDKSGWKNPWDDTLEYNYSFLELFDLAVELSVKYMQVATAFFTKKATLKETLEVLGDNDYNSGLHICG